LKAYATRPWYAPVAAISATLDYFVLASPAQSLFVTTVALHPEKRSYTAVCFSVGAALGALLLAASIQFLGTSFESLITIPDEPSSYWSRMETWINAWGFWALVGLSLIPLPLRSAVILAALAGLSFLTIGLGVLLGRLVVLILMGQLIYRTPQALMRLPPARRLIKKLRVQQPHPLTSTSEK